MKDGFLLIDKPSGCTSAHVVSRLKKYVRPKKIGHAGTLDPMATGLLVILIGGATRLQFLTMDGDKVYEGEIRLGVETDTDDITGRIVRQDAELRFFKERTLRETELLLESRLQGGQMQLPPAYSALKVEGSRSYELARKGEDVRLKERPVVIHEIKLRFLNENTLGYYVRCSKGTYVRSIARDIGRLLDSAATLQSIRRLASHPFAIDEAVPLAAINSPDDVEIKIKPLAAAAAGLPRFEADEREALALQRGDQSPLCKIAGSNAPVYAIFQPNGDLVGIAACEAGAYRLRCVLHGLH